MKRLSGMMAASIVAVLLLNWSIGLAGGVNVGIFSSVKCGYIVTSNMPQYDGAKENDGIDDKAAILKTLDRINTTTGGMLYLKTGTYNLASPLVALNHNNLTIKGDGKGATIITDGGVDYYPTYTGFGTGNWNNAIGMLMIMPTASTGPSLTNIRVEGISFRRTVAAPADESFARRIQGHVVTFQNVKGITFDDCEFSGGYAEGLYTEGYVSTGGTYSSERVKVLNCYFHDMPRLAAFNTNGTTIRDITVGGGSTFERVKSGMLILGENIDLGNFSMKDIRRSGVEIGESNVGGSTRSLSSTVIHDFTIEGLGRGATTLADMVGILVATRGVVFPDDTEDVGITITDGVIQNSYFSAFSAKVAGISAYSGVKINNVQIVGLKTDGTTPYFAYGIEFNDRFGAGGDPRIATAYMSNNIVKKLRGTNEKAWSKAVAIDTTIQSGSAFYSANDYFEGTESIVLVPPSGVTLELANTRIKGQLTGQGSWGVFPINADGSLDNLPLTGSNPGTLTANGYPVLATPLTVNSATPAVMGISFAQTANTAPTAYTNFTGGATGQLLTIQTNDAFTSINHTANIRLIGAADLALPAPSIITLRKSIGGPWVEQTKFISPY